MYQNKIILKYNEPTFNLNNFVASSIYESDRDCQR